MAESPGFTLTGGLGLQSGRRAGQTFVREACPRPFARNPLVCLESSRDLTTGENDESRCFALLQDTGFCLYTIQIGPCVPFLSQSERRL